MTGAPQGEELCLIKPLSDSSFSCSDKSFISEGASRYGARATGAAPVSQTSTFITGASSLILSSSRCSAILDYVANLLAIFALYSA
nr:hypothetical protein [Tanacetum cinerariifolium]